MRNAWVGTGKEVADQMEQWFTEHACDGFVVGATHVPGGYEDFVRFVVPELQRRGIFRQEYRGAPLRANMGLDRPTIGRRASAEPRLEPARPYRDRKSTRLNSSH